MRDIYYQGGDRTLYQRPLYYRTLYHGHFITWPLYHAATSPPGHFITRTLYRRTLYHNICLFILSINNFLIRASAAEEVVPWVNCLATLVQEFQVFQGTRCQWTQVLHGTQVFQVFQMVLANHVSCGTSWTTWITWDNLLPKTIR